MSAMDWVHTSSSSCCSNVTTTTTTKTTTTTTTTTHEDYNTMTTTTTTMDCCDTSSVNNECNESDVDIQGQQQKQKQKQQHSRKSAFSLQQQNDARNNSGALMVGISSAEVDQLSVMVKEAVRRASIHHFNGSTAADSLGAIEKSAEDAIRSWFKQLQRPAADQDLGGDQETKEIEMPSLRQHGDSIGIISTDVLMTVLFPFCDAQALCRASAASKKWYEMCNSDELWKNICLKKWPQDVEWIDEANIFKNSRSWKWFYECRQSNFVNSNTSFRKEGRISYTDDKIQYWGDCYYTLTPVRHGYGYSINSDTKERFEGIWVNGLRSCGISITPGGDRYEGPYDEKGRYHGVGKLITPKFRFEGDFVHGIKQGKGKMSWPSGARYEGDFNEDYRTGHGHYVWPNKNEYKGDFHKNQVEGFGTKIYYNGDRYVGYWQDNNKNGEGTFWWANGDKYIGQFKDGNKHGRGELIRVNGEHYTGEHVNGKFHGKGVLIDPHGVVFEGEFANGRFISGTTRIITSQQQQQQQQPQHQQQQQQQSNDHGPSSSSPPDLSRS